MKLSHISSLRFLVVFATYFLSSLIAENLFPFNIYTYEGVNHLFFYVIYIICILIKTFLLVWLINTINQNRIKLIVTVIFIMYGLQTFVILTEIWYFKDVYNFGASDIKVFILQNLFTLLITVPVAVWIYGLYDRDVLPGKKITFSLKWIWLSLIYILIYFVFRYTIIRISDTVRGFYWEESEILNLFEFIKINLESYRGIVFFQATRGFLYIVFSSPVIYWYRGKEKNKLILLILLMGFLPSLQLLEPNPLMNYYMVRLSLFLGIVLSNTIYAGVIYFLLSKFSVSNQR